MGTSGTQLGRIESGAVEQRLSPRKRVDHSVSIELPSGKTARLHDIGEGGLSVSGSSGLVPGSVASIRLKLPEINSAIEVIGTVAWSEPSGRAGVRFTGIPSGASTALREWLQGDPSATNSGLSESNDSVLQSKIASLAEISELQANICSRQLDRDAALDLIVNRMIELTRATGAAIALREGEHVICRASAGNAPDVGVKLSLSSLSGECFRTGAMVLLSDSDSDPRVDPEICRQLNFRSLLVLPITADLEVVGIAEVLSPAPHNFEGSDVLVLSFLSDLIAGVAAPAKENASSESEIPAMLASLVDELEAIPPAADVSQIAPLSLTTELQLATNLELSTTADKKVGLRGGVSESAESSTLKQNSGLAITAPKSAPIAPAHRVPSARSIVEAKATSRRIANEITGGTVPRFGSQYSVSAERRGVPLALVVAAALAVLVSAVFFFIYPRRSPVSPTAVARVATPTAVSQPAQTPLAAPSSSTPAASASAKNAAKSTSEAVGHRISEPAKRAPVVEAPSELQVIQGAKRTSTTEKAPDAPQIAQLSGSSLNLLPASVVSAKTADPRLQVVQSQGVSGGKLLKKVMPRYPDEARRAGISGDVVMSATIGTDGILHNLKVITGSPVLRGEALAAARQWRYIPAMLSGRPVETDTRITISFHHQ